MRSDGAYFANAKGGRAHLHNVATQRFHDVFNLQEATAVDTAGGCDGEAIAPQQQATMNRAARVASWTQLHSSNTAPPNTEARFGNVAASVIQHSYECHGLSTLQNLNPDTCKASSRPLLLWEDFLRQDELDYLRALVYDSDPAEAFGTQFVRVAEQPESQPPSLEPEPEEEEGGGEEEEEEEELQSDTLALVAAALAAKGGLLISASYLRGPCLPNVPRSQLAFSLPLPCCR